MPTPGETAPIITGAARRGSPLERALPLIETAPTEAANRACQGLGWACSSPWRMIFEALIARPDITLTSAVKLWCDSSVQGASPVVFDGIPEEDRLRHDASLWLSDEINIGPFCPRAGRPRDHPRGSQHPSPSTGPRAPDL